MDGRGDGGSYIDFGRSEEYVNFGTEGNQAFTVEFWVKVTKGGGKDQNVFLSTYMGGDGWRNGWMMYWRNADGGIYRATWGETGGNICEPSLRHRKMENGNISCLCTVIKACRAVRSFVRNCM